MAAALLMIRICVVRVCTTVKGSGYAEHSQFARYTAGANFAPRAICQRLRCALVLFKKSRRYLPRSALGQPSICRSPPGPCLDVYLEDGRIQIDNNLVENFILRTALGKRTGCSQAMPMPANAAPSLNCHSRLPHLRSKFQNYGGWRDAYPVSARSTLRLPTTFLYSSLAKRFRRRCTRRTTGVGLKDAPRPSTRARSSRSTS